MFRFEELEIWKLAQEYAIDCYNLVGQLPTKENFALSGQLRRAAVSISNNIAEGFAFRPIKFKNFLDISIGSALETVNIVSFAIRIGYLKREVKPGMYEKSEELIRKIRSFKKYLNTND